jgi:hypothetical protein
MTAKQLLEYAAEYLTDKDLFSVLSVLQTNQLEMARQLESAPNNKRLIHTYNDLCEKMQIIQLMQSQRLELFYQSGL